MTSTDKPQVPPSPTADRPEQAAPCCSDHDHDHEHEHEHGQGLPGPWRLAAALLFALAAESLPWLSDSLGWPLNPWWGRGLAVLGLWLAGWQTWWQGWQALRRGRVQIEALMAVAVTGALLIGQWAEAAMVMALYALAETLEHRAADRARHAIRGLLQLVPKQAQVRQPDGRWQQQPVAQVQVGDTLLLPAGERVPLDGVVSEGLSAVDESPLTGESLPQDKTPGDRLLAGSLNQQATLQMRVTQAPGQSTLDGVVQAVQAAQTARAPSQRWVDRFARRYTPAVLLLALALATLAPLALGWAWSDAFYRALVLLVMACPCALVISTPVTLVSGLTAAARRGILIKGGQHLEAARHLRAIGLDKTGTLTQGRAEWVAHGSVGRPSGPADTPDWLTQAWALSLASTHPVAQAIARGLAQRLGADQAPTPALASAQVGQGLTLRQAGHDWRLGNARWLQQHTDWSPALDAIAAEQGAQARSLSWLSCDRQVLGWLAVSDPVRPGAQQAITDLQSLGVQPVLLSGDNPLTVAALARQVGLREWRAELLPQDKLDALATLRQAHGPVGMAGDGINDAPALAGADLGFAMGGVGTGVAVQAADVVIMNDDPRRLAETVRLSRRTHTVLQQNLLIALGLKLLFVALAVAGLGSLWLAVVADLGASLIVIMNGLRLLRQHPAAEHAQQG